MTHLQPVDEAFVADLRKRGTAPSEHHDATVSAVRLSGRLPKGEGL